MIIFMCRGYEHAIVITNRKLVRGDFFQQMEKVIRLHPCGVILREKDLTDGEYEEMAEKILEMCDREGVRCFLHSRFEVARRLGCRRIHVSIPVLEEMGDEERERMKEEFEEISVSCHSMADVEFAVRCGGTQIVLGTIFETECKAGLKGKGVEFVREVSAACSVPVYAIGGIDMQRLRLVMENGAAGGCMMSGFMRLEVNES